MKNNTLKALGIAIGAAMSVMLASDMEVHAAEVYDAESGKIVESVGCGSDDQEEAEEDNKTQMSDSNNDNGNDNAVDLNEKSNPPAMLGRME